MNVEILYWWLGILTVLFIVESSFVVYFVKWIVWRVNTTLAELIIDKRERETDET
mgnify:CR=1 FL=1